VNSRAKTKPGQREGAEKMRLDETNCGQRKRARAMRRAWKTDAARRACKRRRGVIAQLVPSERSHLAQSVGEQLGVADVAQAGIYLGFKQPFGEEVSSHLH
jgi:hypothetical protein